MVARQVRRVLFVARSSYVDGGYGVLVMERRKHPRSDAIIHARIEAHGLDCQGLVRDISTRGIFVELEQGQADMSARNVRLYFEIETGGRILSRQISGRIVRNEGAGLAIRFAENDVLGRAVVHELMYYMELTRLEFMPNRGCTHDRIPELSGDCAA